MDGKTRNPGVGKKHDLDGGQFVKRLSANAAATKKVARRAPGKPTHPLKRGTAHKSGSTAAQGDLTANPRYREKKTNLGRGWKGDGILAAWRWKGG